MSPGAFEQIAEQQRPRLYRTAIALCRNRDDAQDLVQDTLVQAMRKWDQFEGPSDPATWLYTIAARLCHRLATLDAAAEVCRTIGRDAATAAPGPEQGRLRSRRAAAVGARG